MYFDIFDRRFENSYFSFDSFDTISTSLTDIVNSYFSFDYFDTMLTSLTDLR